MLRARRRPHRVPGVRLPVLSLAGALWLLTAGTVDAQEVQGVLRREADGAPLGGTVVVAVRLANGAIMDRTVSAPTGRYRLHTGTDSVALRVLRIGQRPVTVATLQLVGGEVRTLDATVPEAPIALAAVRTQVDTRCRARPDSASVVAQLYAEARTALIATQAVVPDGRPLAHYVRRSESLDRRGRPLRDAQVRAHRDTTLRPFRSVPWDELATGGFVVPQADGGAIYRAPDAELLTDERFLVAYCLRFVAGRGDRSGEVGIGFEPAERRRVGVGVRGTLWLDAVTRELRTLEFSYVGLDATLERANPGGAVQYARLDNGAWFVREWTLRMPNVRRITPIAPRGIVVNAPPPVLTTEIEGGEVTRIEIGGALAYARGTSAAEATTGVADADAAMALLLATCPGASAPGATEAVVHGTVRERGRPAGDAVVRAAWRENVRAITPTAFAWDDRTVEGRTEADGAYALCSVPRARRVEVAATRGEHRSLTATVEVPATRPRVTVDLELRPPR
jgi:hypothetical protein